MQNSTDQAASLTSQPRIRLMLVDDIAQVRSDLRLLLELTDGIEVIAEASNGLEALSFAKSLQPNVVVTDLEMPGMDGIELARQIKAQGLPCRVILMSIHEGSEIRHRAEQVEVDAFFAKGDDLECLVKILLQQ